jgi:hypothetical protein
MRSARLNGSAEINQSSEMDVGKNSHELVHASGTLRQVENGADEVAANGLEDLLRLSEVSMREIENLIGELRGLREKLKTDCDRIKCDVAEYVELSQGVMQLTAIISDSVKELPRAPRISR